MEPFPGKRFEDLDKKDIQNLINLGVPESKVVDYKKLLPGNKISDKKDFRNTRCK